MLICRSFRNNAPFSFGRRVAPFPRTITSTEVPGANSVAGTSTVPSAFTIVVFLTASIGPFLPQLVGCLQVSCHFFQGGRRHPPQVLHAAHQPFRVWEHIPLAKH